MADEAGRTVVAEATAVAAMLLEEAATVADTVAEEALAIALIKMRDLRGLEDLGHSEIVSF
jgi:hypothetical protein